MKTAIILTLLLLVACTTTQPETLENIKELKAAGEPVSELDRCMQEADKNQEALAQCTKNKLATQGYTDGIDCIAEFDTPPCQDTQRYNAEVDANNECLDEQPQDAITVTDCLALAN